MFGRGMAAGARVNRNNFAAQEDDDFEELEIKPNDPILSFNKKKK